MRNGMVHEQNLEKQMGCMAGFLQIFDRSQIVAGKRLYSAKRLPHSNTADSVPGSEKAVGSPTVVRPAPTPEPRSPARENLVPAASEIAPRSPLPLPVFEFKEGTRSSWKFSREAPRLSLDSRAVVDAKGGLFPRGTRTNAAAGDDGDKNRRSPSVIARLMGLDAIQSSDPEQPKQAELRRSASESRVNRDLNHQYRFAEANASPSRPNHARISSNVTRDHYAAASDQDRASDPRPSDPKTYAKSEPADKAQNRGIWLRKSYFNSADFFPEPKQTATTVYGEIERKLKMRGIDEPSKDLESLKQILEALQLKGLLHPRKASSQIDHRNYVYDRNTFSYDDSPIVVMRPARLPAPTSRSPRLGNEFPPPPSSSRSPRNAPRRNPNIPGDSVHYVSPRRERSPRNQSPCRTVQSQTVRTESCTVKSPNRRRPLSIDTQRREIDGVSEQRRVSPVNSPKVNSRRHIVPDQRSPRSRKSTVEISRNKDPKALPPVEDESSTLSDSTSTDTDRAKTEEYKEGRNLLERCDKLLHSIAEITAAELQPSPVSVLDPSFYKDESSTSPIMKRSIEFKDRPIELEDEIWESAISLNDGSSEDCDLIYISEILRATNRMPEDLDVFQLLEKQQYLKGNDTSKVSMLRRRLIFDTITEILSRSRQLPPWNADDAENSSMGQTSLSHVWSEFRRIRQRDESQDLFEVICGVLRRDLAGDAIHGWKDFPVEISEAVLDIERLIFKDLIGETIRDLATFCVAKCHKPSPSCRMLVF